MKSMVFPRGAAIGTLALFLLPALPYCVPAATPETPLPVTVPTEKKPERVVTVLSGTPVLLKTTKEMVSGKKPTGSWIEFVAAKRIIATDGSVAVAEGAYAYGRVLRSKKRALMGQSGKLEFVIDYVHAVDGSKIPLSARITKGGQDNQAAAIVGTLFLSSLCCAVRGRDTVVPAGSEVTAYIENDTQLNIANVPPAVTAAGPPAARPNEKSLVDLLNGSKVAAGKKLLLKVTPFAPENAVALRIVAGGTERIARQNDFSPIALDTTGLEAGKRKLLIQITLQDGTLLKEQAEIEVF
jgi:hypothetical protein